MVTTAPTKFTFDDLLSLYLEWDEPGHAYEHITAILEEAEKRHQAAWYARTKEVETTGSHGALGRGTTSSGSCERS